MATNMPYWVDTSFECKAEWVTSRELGDQVVGAGWAFTQDFCIMEVTRGFCEGLQAVGVGGNKKQWQRAASLAVAVAMEARLCRSKPLDPTNDGAFESLVRAARSALSACAVSLESADAGRGPQPPCLSPSRQLPCSGGGGGASAAAVGVPGQEGVPGTDSDPCTVYAGGVRADCGDQAISAEGEVVVQAIEAYRAEANGCYLSVEVGDRIQLLAGGDRYPGDAHNAYSLYYFGRGERDAGSGYFPCDVVRRMVREGCAHAQGRS